MTDGYEQEDRDQIDNNVFTTLNVSAEDIYNQLGCDAIENGNPKNN